MWTMDYLEMTPVQKLIYWRKIEIGRFLCDEEDEKSEVVERSGMRGIGIAVWPPSSFALPALPAESAPGISATAAIGAALIAFFLSRK